MEFWCWVALRYKAVLLKDDKEAGPKISATADEFFAIHFMKMHCRPMITYSSSSLVEYTVLLNAKT
jgi:hypothetical protein